jgi:hypothetical protein
MQSVRDPLQVHVVVTTLRTGYMESITKIRSVSCDFCSIDVSYRNTISLRRYHLEISY